MTTGTGLPPLATLVAAVRAAAEGLPQLAGDLAGLARAVTDEGRDAALARYPQLAAAYQALDPWAPAIDRWASNIEAAEFLGIGVPSVSPMKYQTRADGVSRGLPVAKRFGAAPAYRYRDLVLYKACQVRQG